MPELNEILEEMRPIIKNCISNHRSKKETLNVAQMVIPDEIQGEYRRQTIEALERLYDKMINPPQ